jgi:hypothetical protein
MPPKLLLYRDSSRLSIDIRIGRVTLQLAPFFEAGKDGYGD